MVQGGNRTVVRERWKVHCCRNGGYYRQLLMQGPQGISFFS
jgi:hypothetical protein